jgi:hypothetical protein
MLQGSDLTLTALPPVTVHSNNTVTGHHLSGLLRVSHPTRRKSKETLWRRKQWFPKHSYQQWTWPQCLQVQNLRLSSWRSLSGQAEFTALVWVDRLQCHLNYWKKGMERRPSWKLLGFAKEAVLSSIHRTWNPWFRIPPKRRRQPRTS